MKRNKLTLLVAILLLGAMLLASCDEPTKPSDPLFNQVENDYSETVGAWTEYLSYVAPEKTPEYTATEILSDLKLTDETPVTFMGELIMVTEIKENIKTIPVPEGAAEGTLPEEVHVSTTTTHKFYNKNTGAHVKTLTQIIGEVFDVEGTDKYDETLDPKTQIAYELNEVYGLIEVITVVPVLREVAEGAEPLDPLVVNNYEAKRTYSYYFADGTAFLENLKDELVWRNVDNTHTGRYLLDCEETGKTYLMDDGELVRTFDYRMEHNVPVYDEDSTSYAYFEHNGNKYIITEEPPVTVPLGKNLTMFLVQGMSIYVTDKDDKALVSYETECYGITGYAVLSNGDIYTCEFELLSRDATEYDILAGEDKLNVHNKLIKISDGSVTELDLGFKAQKLFNNTTKEIKTFMNYTTLEITEYTHPEDALLLSASVKDGYMLAEIQKYEDGVLDGATTWAVLDETMKIVAELPAIVADQFTYPSFMNADTMIVSARAVGNEIINYAADLKSGEVTLIPDTLALNNVELLNNGYFWNNKVYSLDWRVLRDFNPSNTDSSSSYTIYTGFRIINGDLYYYEYSSSSSTPPTYPDWRCFSIKAERRVEYTYEWDDEKKNEVEVEHVYIDYNTDVKDVFDDSNFISDALVKEISNSGVTYYSIGGKELLADEVYDTKIYSEKLDSNITYEVTQEIVELIEIEDGYLAKVRLAYANDTLTTSEESGIPQNFNEYEYYIIK